MPARLALALLLLLAAPAQADTLAADEARARAAQGELTLIDVRLPTEWAETGLPEGAVGIPLQDRDTGQPRPAFVQDVRRALDGERDRPVALICATGKRSAYAAAMLERSGFAEVHHVAEGMAGSRAGPGWLARGLPTEPCRVC